MAPPTLSLDSLRWGSLLSWLPVATRDAEPDVVPRPSSPAPDTAPRLFDMAQLGLEDDATDRVGGHRTAALEMDR